MSKKIKTQKKTSEENEDTKLQTVAKEIEMILLKNNMAIQPFMNRTSYGTFASARIVSTLQDKPQENVEQGTDKVEAEGTE